MDIFVARQPIFTASGAVYGYELLFRDSLANVFQCDDHDAASIQVMEAGAFWLDLETITGGKLAFVNFTRDTLVRGFAQLLPPSHLVVEILEDIVPDDEVVEACKELRSAGYRLALDDFVLHDSNHFPLLCLADIVKADVLQMTAAETRAVPRLRAGRNTAFLAEKVEDNEAFRLGVTAGYSYFQGYFFARPSILRGSKIDGVPVNHLRILYELNRPSIDFDRVTSLIAPEVSLVFKLLRLVNSAWMGLKCRIDSVKHALVMLGEDDVRRWMSLLVLADVSKGKPTELVRTSAVRAFFCQAMGTRRWPSQQQDCFLLGLFSLLDAILDTPMEEAIRDLPLPTDVADTLLGRDTPYRPVYDLTVAYERTDWETVDRCAAAFGVTEAEIADCYFKAVDHAQGAIA